MEALGVADALAAVRVQLARLHRAVAFPPEAPEIAALLEYGPLVETALITAASRLASQESSYTLPGSNPRDRSA
jgi:hypothetical protein